LKNVFSIRYKIFIIYSLLIICILLFTSVITNQMTSNTSVENAVETSERELALIINNLDAKITHIYDYATTVAVNPDVIAMLKKYKTPPQTASAQYQLRTTLSKSVNSILGINRNVAMWDLVALDNKFFGASGYNLTPTILALGTDYFTHTNQKNSCVIQGPYLVKENFPNNPVVPKMAVTKSVVDLENLETIGYVAFFVNESSFAAIFEKNMPPDTQTNFYVLNENNIVLSSSEKDLIGTDFSIGEHISSERYNELCQTGNMILPGTSGNADILYTAKIYEGTNWRVINAVPLNSLLQGQEAVNRFTLMIGILACVITLVLSFWVSYTISKPIHTLSNAMARVSKGDLNQTVITHSKDEMAILYTGFNNLTKKVRALLDEVYQKQEEKNQYQLQLIQSQVKPHFLYNTLETIKSLVDLDLNETASEAISAMAVFYRISLNNGNDIISIQNELELCRQYLYIQKLRYQEYLDYRIEKCEGTENWCISKLTLQPILENAIYHGIKEKHTKGLIVIQLKNFEDHLIFSVIDNGVGMDSETLKNLQNSLGASCENEHLRSFGLSSVNRRIQLLFGKEYGIRIESVLHHYTKVMLTIPKEPYFPSIK